MALCLIALAGCHDREGLGEVGDPIEAQPDASTLDPDPCADITCGEGGFCAVRDGGAVCLCEEGLVHDGARCVALEDPVEEVDAGDPTDPCEDVDCGDFATCAEKSGRTECVCSEGYTMQKEGCVASPVSCDGVTCSGRGQCVVEPAGPLCECDAGYEALGLSCKPALTCSPAELTCWVNLSMSVCREGDQESFRFSDGTVFEGSSAALGYCLGANEAAADGECAGLAQPCNQFGEARSCIEQPGCRWSPADYCYGPTAVDDRRSCRERFNPEKCEQVVGCFWTEPLPTRTDACGPMFQGCREGHRYRVCRDTEGEYFEFEDGTKLRGFTAGRLYCHATTDGTVDGDCTGEPLACPQQDLATCNGTRGCHWDADANACTSVRGCSMVGLGEACTAVEGCTWTAP